MDYLKLDGCNLWTAPGQTQEQAYRQAYDAQAAALRGSGRAITFSESAPAYFQSGEWGNPSWFSVLGWVGQDGQLWREGYDIATYDASNPTASRWSSVLSNYGYNRWIGRYAKPGNWNDPDFLIAGDSGLSDDESRSQVALWSMMAAPMILSSDVAQLSPTALAALGNTDLIAVDQDPAGHQAAVVSSDGSTDVLARPLADGDRAVAVLNRGDSARSITTTLASIGLPGCSASAKDLWSGARSTVGSALTATVLYARHRDLAAHPAGLRRPGADRPADRQRRQVRRRLQQFDDGRQPGDPLQLHRQPEPALDPEHRRDHPHPRQVPDRQRQFGLLLGDPEHLRGERCGQPAVDAER